MIIGEILGAVAAVGIAIFIVLAIAGFFILSAFMLLAARIVKVENVTYPRAMLATLLGGLTAAAISVPLGFLGLPGLVLGSIGGFLLESLVVKAVFSTSYGKALLTVLLAWVLEAAVVVVVILIVVGTSFLACGL
jgi:hypothetical protein